MTERVLRKPVFVKIKTLQPGTHGHNVHVIVDSFEVVVESEKPNGSKLRVAEAVIGDETGCVKFTAMNEQIDVLKVGATLTLRNSKVKMHENHMRLAVDKWGLVEVAAPDVKVESVNKDNDLSETEYELVSVSQ